MASFDPEKVRSAVEEFTSRRPQKFQDLMPAREVIAELRRTRASYRAIAELLTRHCLPTSKTAIATFCHEVLGEVVRTRRRPGRKRATGPGMSTASTNMRPRSIPSSATESTGNGLRDDPLPSRARGPGRPENTGSIHIISVISATIVLVHCEQRFAVKPPPLEADGTVAR